MAGEIRSYFSTDGGSSWTHYADYDSLALWQAARVRNLVSLGEMERVECYPKTDTAVVSISGWTTDATHTIKIQTPASNKHGGKWNATAYILKGTSAHVLTVTTDYVIIDGLQIELYSGVSYKNAINAGVLPNSIAKNCLIRSILVGNQNIGIYGSLKLQCCVVYGFNNSNCRGVYAYGGTIHANNVTVYGCSSGFQADSLIVARNCLTQSCGTGYSGTQYTGSSNNIKSDSGGSASANATQAAVTFADAANGDFHCPSNSNIGTDLSASGVTTDIDGQTITTWYIGADAVPGAAGGSAQDASHVASGGAVSDGAADIQASASQAGQGGAASGGSTDILAGAAVDASGGASSGGSVAAIQEAAVAVQGGAVSGGAAETSTGAAQDVTHDASGGASSGGQADTSAGAAHDASGGASSSGSASSIAESTTGGQGGAQSDGQADTQLGVVADGSGGSVSGGEADISLGGLMDPDLAWITVIPPEVAVLTIPYDNPIIQIQ